MTRAWWPFGRAPAPVVARADLSDARAMTRLHAASFNRGWGIGEFEDMIGERNTLAQRLCLGRAFAGFAVSRIAADEAELLTIAIDPAKRGRGLSQILLDAHLGALAGLGVRSLFLEVEENNAPARRLYARAGFRTVGRRERYYKDAGSAALDALVMQRDLA